MKKKLISLTSSIVKGVKDRLKEGRFSSKESVTDHQSSILLPNIKNENLTLKYSEDVRTTQST